jgi:hypothetical protein
MVVYNGKEEIDSLNHIYKDWHKSLSQLDLPPLFLHIHLCNGGNYRNYIGNLSEPIGFNNMRVTNFFMNIH